MRARRRVARAVVAAALCMSTLWLPGCSPPPALTKAELDAKKLPTHHPRLTPAQQRACRSCHREQPAIKAGG